MREITRHSDIKKDLERKRSALSSAIQSSMGSSRDGDGRREVMKDPYGTASLTHDDEANVAVTDRRARELEKVARAPVAIKPGRYGVCRECGGPIAPARLRAMPFATRCVGCQARLEGLGRAA